jgi:hypothetical protein
MLAAVVGYGRLLAFSEKDPEWPAMAGNNALTTIDTLQFAAGADVDRPEWLCRGPCARVGRAGDAGSRCAIVSTLMAMSAAVGLQPVRASGTACQHQKRGSAAIRNGAKALLVFLAMNVATAALSCKKVDGRLK